MFAYLIRNIDTSLLVVLLSCSLVVLFKFFKTICNICFDTFQDIV